MNAVHDAMKRLGLTQGELGQKLDLSQSTISRYASGARPIDTRTSLAIDGLLARAGEFEREC